MRIKIENVIWQFAKAFRKKFVADHPGLEFSMSVAAVAAFGALKANGHAEECVDRRRTKRCVLLRPWLSDDIKRRECPLSVNRY